MDSLGPSIAGADYEINRARTQHANTLRQLAAQRLAASRGISEQLASQGTLHSSVSNKAQIDLNKQLNEQMASADQGFADKLNSLARKRIQSEVQFNVNSLLPG